MCLCVYVSFCLIYMCVYVWGRQNGGVPGRFLFLFVIFIPYGEEARRCCVPFIRTMCIYYNHSPHILHPRAMVAGTIVVARFTFGTAPHTPPPHAHTPLPFSPVFNSVQSACIMFYGAFCVLPHARLNHRVVGYALW